MGWGSGFLGYFQVGDCLQAQNTSVKVALTFIIHDMGVGEGIAIVNGD